jgi:hypothetical protein
MEESPHKMSELANKTVKGVMVTKLTINYGTRL